MQITYEKNYRKKCSGEDWDLMSDVGRKDSLIVYQLEKVAEKHTHLSFDEMAGLLRDYYKNRDVRSRCDIYEVDGRVEVVVKGVFPRFYILKH